ncbi:hypothetical protein PVAND_015584 [Polypedilum vanderplanki]|uniref:Uncharacterized protein n=1 Tax=Polypedilum vanderplanki TaxID=319348 RepID=A0A9J6BCL7_POLVA|nr:hypothetical protein PVAND_015584 [Polypedilum vanderplanki]
MNTKIILIFIFLTSIMSTSADKLECEFKEISSFYSCLVKDNGIFGNYQVIIDEIEGVHEIDKNIDDVKSLLIKNISNVTYVPKNLDKYFENLENFKISGSNLIFIHPNDLQNLTKLKEINLSENQLEIIEEDLFKYNLELREINLEENKIFHIFPSAFDNLAKLSVLKLNGNVCQFSNDSDVKSLIQDVKNRQCYSDINIINVENTTVTAAIGQSEDDHPKLILALSIIITVGAFLFIALIAIKKIMLAWNGRNSFDRSMPVLSLVEEI